MIFGDHSPLWILLVGPFVISVLLMGVLWLIEFVFMRTLRERPKSEYSKYIKRTKRRLP